jgi:formylglycine-generating enzyme required for sulfatase activity
MKKIICSILVALFFFTLNAQDTDMYKKMGIEWVKIKGGTFQMGSKRGDLDERPVHTVELEPFFISKYEVTFDQYDAFCEDTDRKKPEDVKWGRGKRPVINVNWNDAMAFCKWLSQKTGDKIHLPTEAQWEYAARGGNTSSRYLYSGNDKADSIAWYAHNSDKTTQPVGQKLPNERGIHDMSGNICEWCQDWYDRDYYSHSPKQNPRGPESGYLRVIRGGSWYDLGEFLRCTNRDCFPPIRSFWHIGFRIVRVVTAVDPFQLDK